MTPPVRAAPMPVHGPTRGANSESRGDATRGLRQRMTMQEWRGSGRDKGLIHSTFTTRHAARPLVLWITEGLVRANERPVGIAPHGAIDDLWRWLEAELDEATFALWWS